MKALLAPIRKARDYALLPPAAKAERRQDRRGLPADDPGVGWAIDAAVEWLGRAQDQSLSGDGGVARHYSLVTGWSASYPETTGYIVPTILDAARVRGDEALWRRAKRMLDFLVAIQFPDGAFQGGVIGSAGKVPVTFNTGQILLGLAAGAREPGGDAYREPMHRAASWLKQTQDTDGCWRRYATPFASPGEKTYETHVAWGLLEAARVDPGAGFEDAALANVRWALGRQRENGWFESCCLSDPLRPLTHTLGYVLRGVLEAYRFSHDEAFLRAGRRTADGLLTALRADGFLPGKLDAAWTGAASWACLTGTVQVAHCWLMLSLWTGYEAYRDAAFLANRYVRRTLRTDCSAETRGGVKGSFPVSGQYGSYQYLNWACKFFIDSNRLEKAVREEGARAVRLLD